MNTPVVRYPIYVNKTVDGKEYLVYMKDYEYNGNSEKFNLIANRIDVAQDNTRTHLEWVDEWRAATYKYREDYDARRDNVLQMLKSTNFTIDATDKNTLVISWRYPRNEHVSETKGYLMNLVSERTG